MTIISMPAAAQRTRVLSTQRSPFALPTEAWGTRVCVHNYIRPTGVGVVVRGDLRATKQQAAPPRGVPR